MSFAFPTVEAETGIPITERTPGFIEYFKRQAFMGSEYTLGGAAYSWLSDLFDDSPLLDPKTANQLYMMPEGMEFTEPVRDNRAARLSEKYNYMALLQAQLDTFGDVHWSKDVAGFAGGVLGGMMNPVDFGLNWIPFVGSSTKAAALAKMGAGRMTQMATRGLLLSEETIAKHIAYPRVTAAVIDATAGNLVAELGVAVEAIRNKEDYDFAQFSFNVAGGALFAAGIHGATRAFGKGIDVALKQARETHAKMTPETHNAALGDAVNQVIRGEKVDVTSRVNVDPKVMEAEWRAREGGIIAEAEAIVRKESVGSLTAMSEIAANREARGLPLDEEQTKAALEDPNFAARVSEIKAGSSKTIDERLSNVPEYVRDEIKRQHDLAKTIGKLDEIVNSSVSGRTASDVAVEVLPGYPISDAKDMVRAVRAAEGIPSQDDIRTALVDSPEYQAFIQERVKQYVAEKKKAFDEEYQRKFAQEQAAKAVQEIGPRAKPEDIAKLDGTKVPEAALADIKEDVRALSTEAEADLKALELDDPELAALMRKEMDRELKAIDDPEPKAVEAALRCLINNE